MVTSIKTGDSDTFFCKIENIQIDESIEVGDTFDIDLTKFDPIIYSGLAKFTESDFSLITFCFVCFVPNMLTTNI